MNNTDQVNTQAFSSGVTADLRILNIRAEKLQFFINQAPALLVSIGLLGTFAGLTSGLSEIQDVLQPNISPQDATLGLGKIITPMSLAFRTSLQGLTLSLILTVLYQVTGWKYLLDQLNCLLASWLEIALPIKAGEKLTTPLRNAIVNLNDSTNALPECIERAIHNSMSISFSEKLDEFFDIYSNLSSESIRIVNSLGSLAGSFSESSADYLEASRAFQDCNFAQDLERCVEGLNQSKADMLHSSEKLCDKLSLIREDFSGVKSNWDVLTSLASEQLRSAKDMLEASKLKNADLEIAITTCNTNTIELTKATKELRNTRLEVGKDRKSMQSSAIAIEDRLNAASQLDNSHNNLIASYQKVIESWRLSTEKMGSLYNKIIEEANRNSNNVHNKSLTTSKIYEDILNENSSITDKLIGKLKGHIKDVESHHQIMIKTLNEHNESYKHLIERSENANQTFDQLLENKNKESAGRNQPWRFGR